MPSWWSWAFLVSRVVDVRMPAWIDLCQCSAMRSVGLEDRDAGSARRDHKDLRATPLVLRTLVNGVDDGRLRRRPAPGEWAIIEVVAHLADTEERALSRVRRMLAEEDPQGEQGVMSVELYETHVAAEVDHLAQIA